MAGSASLVTGGEADAFPAGIGHQLSHAPGNPKYVKCRILIVADAASAFPDGGKIGPLAPLKLAQKGLSMGNVISAELWYLRKDLVNRLQTGQYPFTPGEMTTLLSIINEFLKSGNGSFFSLLFSIWGEAKDLYITKLIFLRSQLKTKIFQDGPGGKKMSESQISLDVMERLASVDSKVEKPIQIIGWEGNGASG